MNRQTDRQDGKENRTKGRKSESKTLSQHSRLADCFVSSVLLRWLGRMHLDFQLELLRCRSALRTWTTESSFVLGRTTISGFFGSDAWCLWVQGVGVVRLVRLLVVVLVLARLVVGRLVLEGLATGCLVLVVTAMSWISYCISCVAEGKR